MINSTNDILITFLGTSSGVPTQQRNVSALAIRLPQRSEIWLFDCGEATQHQIIRNSELNISQIRRIFITHMHGDHIYGLPGLLSTLNNFRNNKDLDIYGPPELENYIKAIYQFSHGHFAIKVHFHPVQSGLLLDENEYQVYSAALDHRLPAWGYRIVEKNRCGQFNLEKALADGIPVGPFFKILQTGATVVLPDGRQVCGQDYVGPSIAGRSFAYCTDTIFCENAIELAQQVDVLIHEATFAAAEEDLAYRYKHSTAAMAAQVAQQAQARLLILTHFSPRYAAETALLKLQYEAQQVFPNVVMAADGFTYAIINQLTHSQDT